MRFRFIQKSYFAGRIVEPGEIIDAPEDTVPSPHMIPVDTLGRALGAMPEEHPVMRMEQHMTETEGGGLSREQPGATMTAPWPYPKPS